MVEYYTAMKMSNGNVSRDGPPISQRNTLQKDVWGEMLCRFYTCNMFDVIYEYIYR